MSFVSCVGIELQKIRRSKILWLLWIPAVLLWLPALLNLNGNFVAQAEGMALADNYRIQGFLAMTWFMYPACMVVCTVLLSQLERNNRGMVKMLTLPVNPAKWSAAKFVVLLLLAAAQVAASTAAYFASAALATWIAGTSFLSPPLVALREAAAIYGASIPMLAVFWMLATVVRTPVFSVGMGFAAIVPSVLMINTSLWFVYPLCYPLYWANWERGQLAAGSNAAALPLLPWIPLAVGIAVLSLLLACLRYGAAERE